LNAGSTALFTCQATGTPIPSISWYFNGILVDELNIMKYIISETSLNSIVKRSTLTINNVELSEMGSYTCNATNLVSSDLSTAVLTVNGEWVN